MGTGQVHGYMAMSNCHGAVKHVHVFSCVHDVSISEHSSEVHKYNEKGNLCIRKSVFWCVDQRHMEH